MAADPYKYFRIEAREILDGLSSGLLALERPPVEPDVMARLLRHAHTLKGAARVVRLPEIADLSHQFEDLLGSLGDEGQPPRRTQVDALLALVDQIATHVARLRLEEPSLSAASAASSAAAAGANATEAPSPQLSKALVQQEGSELDAMLDSLSQLGAELSTLRAAVARVSGGGERADLERGLDRAERELKQARHAAETVRLVPAQVLFASLERAARDAGHSLSVGVRFSAEGGEVRMDAHVIAGVQPALIQLIRNAVAHGLESVQDRAAAGKPADGHVQIEVERRWGRVVFRCSDDGRGIDLGSVRRVAAERGLLSEEAGHLAPDELMGLLLRGGVSTSKEVTQVSGRGIGMDIVRDSTERLGGEVAVSSVPGRGTQVSLTLPISVSSLEVLVVIVAGAPVALPLDAVRQTVRISAEDVVALADGQGLRVGAEVMPYGGLAQALGGSESNPGASQRWQPRGTAVVINADGGTVAVAVDAVVGTESVVVRSVPRGAPADETVGGLWLDARGFPQLVLDPSAVIKKVTHASASAARKGARALLPILVVDDSLTTRRLEQSILETAGYEVALAVSAEDGLAKARQRPFGLFLVDVEMPGMDGFAFIETVRADPALRNVPAILVTSRDAPEDRARGQAVGANGYMVKSEFDQKFLLGSIQRLLGER